MEKEMKKFPKTIPYSSIDWEKLRQTTEQMKQEREQKERIEAQKNKPWTPYMDLSRRRDKRKDHTAQFKEVYAHFEKDFNSENQKTKDFARLAFGMTLKEIAGRPLTGTEIKMITMQCLNNKPRYKITAFGEMYTTKEENGEDIYTK